MQNTEQKGMTTEQRHERADSNAMVRLIRAAESLTPIRILVVEDDAEMRRLLVRALRAQGYVALGAADADHALEWLGSASEDKVPRFDLVISDIRMPGGSGLDLLASIRAADCSMPVVLITAFGSDETRREARRLGAVVVVDKPFEMDELSWIVSQLLSTG